MPALPEERLRICAVIGALKGAGIRVKNWKSFLNSGNAARQESRCVSFAFGRDLVSLPQCHLPEVGGFVPKFLVDSCAFLSLHLHTEGLFRKTGSLSRIRSLRAALEHGDPVFSPPRSAALQPCDVATLLKQFLRELPAPLIPFELQGPLFRAQGLEADGFQDGERDRIVLMVTALFPASHARALRYFCTFLRNTAKRCSENRMEVGNLALVITPNLLHCPPVGSKLTEGTGRLLDRQAEVVKVLIMHSDLIGVVPPAIMESLSSMPQSGSTTPPTDGLFFQERAALGVYRSLRRQRRRSVGEMFVEALSKLKTGRTPNGHSQHSDNILGQHISPTSQSTSTIKRKSTDDTLPELVGSAKKRRSIHDLREDSKPVVQACTDEKKKSQRRSTKKSQRYPAQENREERRRRRRSLRFFTLTSWSSTSTAVPSDCEADNWLTSSGKVTESTSEPITAEGAVPFKIPLIVIEASEKDAPVTPPPEEADSGRLVKEADLESQSGADDGEVGVHCAVMRTEGEAEVGVAMESSVTLEETIIQSIAEEQWFERENCGNCSRGVPCQGVDVFRRASRPPRRSISLPDVSVGPAASRGEEDEEEEEEGGREFSSADFHECDCSVSDSTGDVSRQLQSSGTAMLTLEDAGLGAKWQANLKPEQCLGSERNKKAGEAETLSEDGGYKKPSQRLSVAEHVRRFNMLTGWLRAPRASTVTQQGIVPPEAPQAAGSRGPVRLRRQGARRFSRSISHEGMSVLLQRPDVKQLPCPEPPRSTKPGNSSQERQWLPPGPPRPQGQSQQQQRRGQHSPWERELDVLCQLHHLGGERLSSHEQLRLQAAQTPHYLTKQQGSRRQPLEQEQPPEEMDLHRRLELQLQLNRFESAEDPEISLKLQSQSQLDKPKDVLCPTFISSQQEFLQQVRPRCLRSPATLLHPSTDAHVDKGLDSNVHMSTHESQTPPPDPGSSSTLHVRTRGDSPLQNEICFDYTPPLSADDTTDVATKGIADDKSGVSSPALQLQIPATRRRYRNSPRWPVSEIRIATWDPVQL
ncbi:uncharacterized protein zgc:153345 isoform X2 [Brienomyrus brachyistius]|uniref:uncharacterized protein zgc:153345 isoform X2 n=1 Tax=Brienomyrus brachyistius TaxID=42636 RepID=UPI0020B30996|nr:uncharacterized protein zgc:153345 isoform X2 [Brienomyrus brachyistius]